MKTKIFIFVIAGLAFSLYSCNNHYDENGKNDDLYGKDINLLMPVDTISPLDYGLSFIPIYSDSFTESELNQMTTLIDMIPDFIVNGFKEKYLKWVETWSRPEICIHSAPVKYAESDEYFSLLNYCKEYGKISWILIVELLSKKSVERSNFSVECMLFVHIFNIDFSGNRSKSEHENLFWYITDCYWSIFVTNGPYGPSYDGKTPTIFNTTTCFAKNLLILEHENILKAIQELSVPEVEE